MTHSPMRPSSDTPAGIPFHLRYRGRSTFATWIILIALFAVVLLVSSTLVSLAESSGNGSDSAPPPQVAATQGHIPYPLVEASDSGWIRLSLSLFSDYTARFYTYMVEEQPIEFFVLQSTDGIVRAAFNACDVCYRSLKGYSQDGQIMVCNNCGSRFPADQINVVRGGCNPSPLDRIVEGDELLIPVESILAGGVYF